MELGLKLRQILKLAASWGLVESGPRWSGGLWGRLTRTLGKKRRHRGSGYLTRIFSKLRRFAQPRQAKPGAVPSRSLALGAAKGSAPPESKAKGQVLRAGAASAVAAVSDRRVGGRKDAGLKAGATIGNLRPLNRLREILRAATAPFSLGFAQVAAAGVGPLSLCFQGDESTGSEERGWGFGVRGSQNTSPPAPPTLL